VLAGPWCSQNLADLGAEVIKVERPGAGDDTRGWGPPFAKDSAGEPTRESAYFLSTNRGKRSITLDIASPEGQAIAKELAAKSDILLENYKVGGLAKYGLDYPTLSQSCPRLIYCSITGFGQTGPYRERAGYDFLMQGMGGLMSITGEPDEVPGGGPLKAGIAVTDIMTGQYATISVLAALQARHATGVGQHIDLALFDVQVAYLSNQAMHYLVSGEIPPRIGNGHPSIVPYQTFRAKDGSIIVATGNDSQYRKLCAVAGAGGRSALPAQCRPRAQPRAAGAAAGRADRRRDDGPLDRRAREGGRALRPDQHDGPGVRGPAGAGARAVDEAAAPVRRRGADDRKPDAFLGDAGRAQAPSAAGRAYRGRAGRAARPCGRRDRRPAQPRHRLTSKAGRRCPCSGAGPTGPTSVRRSAPRSCRG
jgi:crotonobetainyl-CoA:carnitine CoA-transferase CaiB-like acyl-CoA transferase